MKIKFGKTIDNIIFLGSIFIIIFLLYSRNNLQVNIKSLKDKNLILEDKIGFLNYENKLNEEIVGKTIDLNEFYEINERYDIKPYKNSYKVILLADGNTCKPCFYETLQLLLEQQYLLTKNRY